MSITPEIQQLSPEIISRFKTAVETGRWPNGELLTEQQREICLEAIIVWDLQHLPPEERVGYIDRGSKKKDETCDSTRPSSAEQPFDIRQRH